MQEEAEAFLLNLFSSLCIKHPRWVVWLLSFRNTRLTPKQPKLSLRNWLRSQWTKRNIWKNIINQTKIPEIRRIWGTTNSSALPKPLIKWWSKLSWQPLPDTWWLGTDSMEGKFCLTSLTACYSEMSRQGKTCDDVLSWLKKSSQHPDLACNFILL